MEFLISLHFNPNIGGMQSKDDITVHYGVTVVHVFMTNFSSVINLNDPISNHNILYRKYKIDNFLKEC